MSASEFLRYASKFLLKPRQNAFPNVFIWPEGDKHAMGYTVHYESKRLLSRKEVTLVVKEIREIVEENTDLVHLEGHNDQENVAFNGNGEAGYETFVFRPQRRENSFVLDPTFCKTCRKEYDRLVKEAIFVMQKVTNNSFNACCDDGISYFYGLPSPFLYPSTEQLKIGCRSETHIALFK